MFKQLQEKWNVSAGRALLILMIFAIGGSLTGIIGKQIMSWIGISSTLFYIPVYIVTITLVWPFMVLLVSIPFGQFFFFKNYILKMGRRMRIVPVEKQQDIPAPQSQAIDAHASQSFQVKHITIFASGAGSNAHQIIQYFRNSTEVNVALIVCNKPGAGVIDIAAKENIPVLLTEKERFFWGDGYVPELQASNTNLIVLAGFLWKIPQTILNAYPRQIINIHPALLPKYGGKGMYGSYVHQSVLSSGEMESGITIHYVDEHYDNGDVIFQTACPVLEGDTVEKLAQRIHRLEHLHYPRVIEEVLKKR